MLILFTATMGTVWLAVLGITLRPAHIRINARKGK